MLQTSVSHSPEWYEPEPEKIATTCAVCGGDIYKGEECIRLGDEYIHDDLKCQTDYLFDVLGAEYVTAGEDE
ncbi:MAG: hypothetical protein HPY52_10580 [Firmicutes bacterium]|nr:hypothetical protein [Bacillota bacterium]